MKKIHITEAQFNALKKQLNEFNASEMPANLDITQQVNAAGGDVAMALNSPSVRRVFSSDDPSNPTTVSIDPENIKGVSATYTEGRTFTKKQIKEERVRNLKKQCVRITKKSLK